MAIRQTRIFVPNKHPYNIETWAETVLGSVIAPLFRTDRAVEWFWFSRYIESYQDSQGDSDIRDIPEDYEWGNGVYASLRFRFQIPDVDLPEFEQNGDQLISAAGCWRYDWRNWDLVGDLGNTRFLGEQRDLGRQAERAALVTAYLHSVSRLVLHALVHEIDGTFRLEKNDHAQNPLGSSFESMHHLFCNITRVPWALRVQGQWGVQPGIGYNW